MRTNLTIKDRADGHRVIDAIGDNEKKIKRLQAENRKLHALAEEWAKEHPEQAFAGRGAEDTTGTYAYRLEKADPSLRVKSHLTVDDVVTMLGACADTEGYVIKTYDSEAIKDDFGGNAENRKKVEAFGLYFTKTEPHLKIGQPSR